MIFEEVRIKELNSHESQHNQNNLIIEDFQKSFRPEEILVKKKKGVLDYIKDWLSSPFFVLHFCRFGIVIWCWILPSYVCVLLLIW